MELLVVKTNGTESKSLVVKTNSPNGPNTLLDFDPLASRTLSNNIGTNLSLYKRILYNAR